MDYQNDQDLICQFISDTQQGQHRQDHGADLRRRYVNDGERPGTSRDNGRHLPLPPQKPKRVSPEEKANNLIREAKQSRARIHETRGNDWFFEEIEPNFPQYEVDLSNDFVHSAMVDETYHLVGSHVNHVTQDKIIRGEYVDFARLVP